MISYHCKTCDLVGPGDGRVRGRSAFIRSLPERTHVECKKIIDVTSMSSG
jgi:hypothetical protein